MIGIKGVTAWSFPSIFQGVVVDCTGDLDDNQKR